MAKSNSTKKTKLPPTLIIGLGGTGCEIISRVDKLTNPEQRKYIRFVFFDTDANELRVRKEETPYIFTVQTSRRLTVGQALRNDREARENSFPTNPQLLTKPLTEGAGQVRSISKLAFDACLRDGRINPLHDAINELQKLNGDDLEQVMRVVIVSTLVGGTGSGILLPVSLYLRNYLENTCQKKPLIRGFCVLPDVFFHGEKKTDVEKNNLRANAYATLRELDAFMLKADSTQSGELRNRYSLKMPRPGTTDQYDDYCVNPMDFCFLFDGQNLDGDGLEKFEDYKQHAADCIYASSVSLLNKRLNSSEDNTILERCAENGRNRYCGVGTSKIVYPYEDVRDYIAMRWMEQAMTENWLRYDKKYEKEIARRQASRARGVILPPIDQRKYYSDLIQSEQSENNVFSSSIYEECYNKDSEGIYFTSPRWENYYDKLKLYIDKLVSDDDSDKGLKAEIERYSLVLSDCIQQKQAYSFRSNFTTYEQQLKMYFSKTKKRAEARSSIVADSMFSPDNFDITSEHHIEHWLTQNGIPLHPNAVRFFLYSLQNKLEDELRRIETKSDDDLGDAENGDALSAELSFADLEDKVRKFFTKKEEVSPIGGDDAPNVTISECVDKIRKFNPALIETAENVLSQCREHYEDIGKYYSTYLRRAVLKKAIEYIDSLSSNYEYFYKQLDTEIKRIPRSIQRIIDNYSNVQGSPVMYACASETCLNGLLDRCPNTIDPIALTDDFRKKLFTGVYESLRADANKQKDIINNLVSKDIIEFWRNAVTEQYEKNVDMDIIDALAAQAELEEGKYDSKDQFYYIDAKRREALKLSAPFIDRPIGREPYIIYACAMNDALANTDDLHKSSLIKGVFGNFEKDPLMDKYQVVFMQALYNLRVSDLVKFAPADSLEEDAHDAGDYYKAYRARIDGILPDSRKTKILTPHLDKRWHYTGILPSLDDKSEVWDVEDAQKAFFICLAYGYVRFDQDQYRFLDDNGDFISDNIIVEDGKCNRFHEIYDAMLISRPLVRSMLTRFEKTVDKEKKDDGIGNRDYTCSTLYNRLNNLKFALYKDIPTVSVLEIPLLYKASMGNGDFNADVSVQMLHTFMNVLENYLKVFYPNEIKRNPYFVEWLGIQANRMIDNIIAYYDKKDGHAILSDPANDALVNRIINIIVGRLEKYEFTPGALEMKDALVRKWDEFRKL